MSRKVTDKIAAAERQGFWKGGLFMTFYVGVDIAKYEHANNVNLNFTKNADFKFTRIDD